MKKFKNKYRIESTRLKGWDYRNAGAYFITICTQHRKHFFGKCAAGKMTLSTAGAIVQGFWFEIPKHFDQVRLGEFVVMPNHVHGVLILGDNGANATNAVETWHCHVSTNINPDANTNTADTDMADKRTTPNFYKNITPKSGSVSTIIGSFKGICTKHIRKAFPNLHFAWQERFHDHIIRDEKSFQNISNYIINNPKKWNGDKFFT